MKITEKQLKQLVKEVFANVLREQGEIRDPEKARMDIMGDDVIDRTHRYAQTGVATHDPGGGRGPLDLEENYSRHRKLVQKLIKEETEIYADELLMETT